MENRKRNDINELIYGNTAINPKRYPSQPQTDKRLEEEKKLKRLEKENLNKQIQQRNKNKVKVLAGIGIAGVMAFSFIFRTGQFYGYQKQYTDMKVEAREMEKEIEGFRSIIIKNSSIDTIAVKALEAGMIEPGIEDAIYVNLSKDNFSEPQMTEETENKSLFERIADSLDIL